MNPQYKKRQQWKIRVLDSKSPSFCGAKWYNASMWLFSGWTTSCHHNPPHDIDLEAIKTNPRALHNTPIKQQERAMMQAGEKPLNCQFCWVMEETDPDGLADRAWLSGQATDMQLQAAFDAPPTQDFDLTYLEIGFDRTCQMACSYCCPSISSTWAKDVRNNGPYIELVTDQRNHYISTSDKDVKYDYNDQNPYAEAFFKWWDTSLHRTLKQLRITGGEPMMSGHTWRLLEWLGKNPEKTNCRIEMTTNLCYDEELLNKFLSLADIDLSFWIYSSAETTGAKCEYIRDGHDWDLWMRNVETVLASSSIDKVCIGATMSALGADGFAEFLEWLLERKKTLPVGSLSLSVNLVRFPTFQNVVVLPLSLREQYAAEIAEIMNRPEAKELFTMFEQDHINRWATYLLNVEEPHKEQTMGHGTEQYNDQNKEFDVLALQQDFKRFFSQYDTRRGKDFVTTFPRLKEWYNDIQI
jgi:hypothetical protein